MSCPARTSSPGSPAAASPPQVMYAFIQTVARYRSPGLAGRRAGRINDHKITDFCRAVGGVSADTLARLKITLAEVKVAVLRSIKTPLAISKWIGDEFI
jgi:hypothetical protein